MIESVGGDASLRDSLMPRCPKLQDAFVQEIRFLSGQPAGPFATWLVLPTGKRLVESLCKCPHRTTSLRPMSRRG